MKNLLLIFILLIVMQSCYNRIGDLTIAANRNIDNKSDYKLLEQYVSAKHKAKRDGALEGAFDKAVKKVPGGEYMKNIKIYVKKNGKKVKVEGDVWGDELMYKANVNTLILKVGNKVMWKNKLTFENREGIIMGTDVESAIIETMNRKGEMVKVKVPLKKLIKIQ